MQNKETGFLFKNKKKQQPNHPDRTGKLAVECDHCKMFSNKRLSGWLKEKDGEQYLSLSAKSETQMTARPAPVMPQNIYDPYKQPAPYKPQQPAVFKDDKSF